MKVMLVSDSYPPQPDGIAQSTAALHQGLVELGHEVTLVVPHPAAETCTTYLRTVRTAPLKIASYPIALASKRTLSHIISRSQPDVIHVQTLARLGLMATICARRNGIPSVLTWHTDVLAYRDSFPVLNVVIPTAYLMWRSYSVPAMLDAAQVGIRSVCGLDTTREHARMLAAVLSAFDTMITPSAKAEKSVHRILRGRAETVTIPSATVAEVPISAADAAVLARLRHTFPSADHRIMFVGRLSPEKNLDDLLFTLRDTVLPRCPGLELLVVGAQPGRDRRYQRLAVALGIDSAVRFVGAVPNSVVRRLLVDCAALVMPSWTETQGLVLQEAALAGVPSVILDRSLDGLVTNEETGLVAHSARELGASICRLILDPQLRSRLGEAARERAASYSPSVFANRVIQSYRAAQEIHAGAPACRKS